MLLHRVQVSDPQPVPEHGVTVVFVELPNTKIELLHPLGDKSPIQKFLDRNPAGNSEKQYARDDVDGVQITNQLRDT
jgi:hypothetical protein